jgi:aryl-phospho-beta-D-glucosidase BglC (GH1 family)
VWQHPENQQAIMHLFHKAQSHILRKQSQDDEPEAYAGVQPPTMKDVLRYRYHHGSNLGSIFVLERWLTPSTFHETAPGSSELTAVETWIKVEGVGAARQRFEKHWREYVSDDDLNWLRDVGKCTTVRLPIGYFTLGPQFCAHTPFKKVSAVYQNAWEAVKQLICRCNERGIGVLIDLHALPGGANTGDHSGTNSGKAELWGSRSNLQLSTKCVCFVAQQALTMEGVAGIQIVNEAEWDAKGMYQWYDNVLSELCRLDTTVPIYVSDGWNFSRALSWSQSKNRVQSGVAQNPVVIDTHLYWAFSDADKQKSPQQIIYEVPSKLSELDGKDGNVLEHAAAQAVVGEYSCVLTEDSWAKRHDTPKNDLVKAFGNAESHRWQQRAGGSFFWTYRMDWMDGGEWGFCQMTDQQAITPPVSLTLSAADVSERIATAQIERDHRRGVTWGQHCQYWDTNYPGNYEHWRFEHGWTLGFGDAAAFFGTRSNCGLEGGDKIGMLDLWCLKRLRESGQGGTFAWEWETGFRQGVRDFYELAGV